jgi:hypothetical protein
VCENSLGNKNKNKNKNGQVQTLGLIISSPCWNPTCDKPVVTTSIEWYIHGCGRDGGSGGAREGRESYS